MPYVCLYLGRTHGYRPYRFIIFRDLHSFQITNYIKWTTVHLQNLTKLLNSDGYEIVVWDIENSTLHVTLPHTTQIREFDWCFDDQGFFSASDEDGLQIWDANTGKLVNSFGYDLRSLDAHPSENILGAIHDSNPAIIDTNSSNLIYESKQTTSNSSISWNPDGSIFSVFRVISMQFTRGGEALPLFPALVSIDIVEVEVDVYVAGLEPDNTINLNFCAIWLSGRLTEMSIKILLNGYLQVLFSKLTLSCI